MLFTWKAILAIISHWPHNTSNIPQWVTSWQAGKLLGFNSNVMEIEKSQYPQSSKIKNITRFHNRVCIWRGWTTKM
jgi:hypothetical protein